MEHYRDYIYTHDIQVRGCCGKHAICKYNHDNVPFEVRGFKYSHDNFSCRNVTHKFANIIACIAALYDLHHPPSKITQLVTVHTQLGFFYQYTNVQNKIAPSQHKTLDSSVTLGISWRLKKKNIGIDLGNKYKRRTLDSQCHTWSNDFIRNKTAIWEGSVHSVYSSFDVPAFS